MKILDKRVKLYRMFTEKVNGMNTKIYKPLHAGEIWCYLKQEKGGTSSLDDVNGLVMWNTEERLQAVINRRAAWVPKVSDILIYRGKVYDVVFIDEFEFYKEPHLKFYVQLSDDQSPKLSDEVAS